MHRYDNHTQSFPEALFARLRGFRLAFLMVCLAGLAGCANSPTRESPSLTELDSYNMRWVNNSVDADDPIGMLLAQKLRRSARSPGSLAYQDYQGGADTDNTMLAGEALNYLGIRYRYGGSTPDSGFDCSGLVAYVAEQSLGLKLPRNAAEISHVGQPVTEANLQVGDLVFFNTTGQRNSHVGIYLGDERFVHSPRAGGVVRVERMDQAYWTKRYNGARRLDSTLLASAHAQN